MLKVLSKLNWKFFQLLQLSEKEQNYYTHGPNIGAFAKVCFCDLNKMQLLSDRISRDRKRTLKLFEQDWKCVDKTFDCSLPFYTLVKIKNTFDHLTKMLNCNQIRWLKLFKAFYSLSIIYGSRDRIFRPCDQNCKKIGLVKNSSYESTEFILATISHTIECN